MRSHVLFAGQEQASGFSPAPFGCAIDPFGHYADAPPQTDANGEISLAMIDDTLFGQAYTFTATHPLDNARVASVTVRATDDTTVTAVVPGTPGIPHQPSATAGTIDVELSWQEPWEGLAYIDFYRVWIALDPSGPYERVTSGTCAGDIRSEERRVGKEC